MIDKPGYYSNMPMHEYVGDPCPTPSLSTDTVDRLVTQTEAHARLYHPRLGGVRRDGSNRADIGTAVHSLIFGGSKIEFGEYKDFRTKAAQEWRDSLAEIGVTPLLAHQREQVESAAMSAKAALFATFGTGKAEQSMFFQHEGVWLRGRADWLSDDGAVDVDAKTVDSLDSDSWCRNNIKSGALDVQHAIRSLGHKTLANERKHIWMLVEINAPFEVEFVAVGAQCMALGERKVNFAAKKWDRCLSTNKFRGARHDVIKHYDPSAWDETQLDARINNEVWE